MCVDAVCFFPCVSALEYKLNSELEHPIFGAINPVHNLNTRDWKRTLDNVPETEFPKHTKGQLNGSNNGPRESTLLTDDFYDRQNWTQNLASKTNSLKSHNFVDRFNSKYSMFNVSDKGMECSVSNKDLLLSLVNKTSLDPAAAWWCSRHVGSIPNRAILHLPSLSYTQYSIAYIACFILGLYHFQT